MPCLVSLVKRLAVLALPCVLFAGSLSNVLGSQACPHVATHHAVRHGAPTDGPCWCDEMTGAGFPLQPIVDALPPVTTPPAAPVHQAGTPEHQGVPVPESPSLAPTPPPPNARPS
jgi:hypothetical protein